MDLIGPAVMLVLAIISPMLAWWGSSRYFNGRFEEWKRSSEDWRRNVDKRLDGVDNSARATLEENIRLRLDRLEKDVGTHDTGIRGTVHKIANAMSPWDIRFREIEEFMRATTKELEGLKREYKGVSERINARLDRLDRKIP